MVFYGVLSGFGKMLFGAAVEPVGTGGHAQPHGAGGSVLSMSVMTLLAALVVVLGVTVPSFLDNAIKSCVIALGVE
jgi:hypothetical protein